MKKFIAVALLLFCGALTLPGDAVVLIKGKANRTRNLKLIQDSGCRGSKFSGATEVTFKPRKNLQKYKLVLQVRGDDEFNLTFGGGYSRLEESHKKRPDWILCDLFKVNGKELIGPKGSVKEELLSRPKPMPGTIKLKKGEKLVIEFSVRALSKKEAKAAEKKASFTKLSKRQQEQVKREEEKDKARAAEREKELQERKASDEKARQVLSERYGIKFNTKRSSEKQNAAQTGTSGADSEE
jgi:hypothetical protein